MRAIIFSDVHGEPSLITAVVEHSNYNPATDRLIFAGDAVEIGRDSLGCLRLLDELGAECLVGNHDCSAFIGQPIEQERIPEDVLQELGDQILAGRWRMAAEADGILITHAGVSQHLQAAYDRAGSVAEFTEDLNATFDRAVQDFLDTGAEYFDEDGPLWWRPGWGVDPLPGVVQVVGHTPPELTAQSDPAVDWSQRGIYLVDPYVRGWRIRRFASPAPVRYAVIENGHVHVVDA